MTVAEYVFDFLSKKGINTVYMVSGSSSMWLLSALQKNETFNTICCHHEQAAAMAADGYGRVNNLPGVCLVSIGPGATNAITGVAQAYVDSSPMFVLSGQANSKLLKYEIQTGIRQYGTQSLNLEPMVKSITKYFAAILEPEKIRFHMEKAYMEAMEGRKGPVWIDIPTDIQNKQIPDDMQAFERKNLKIRHTKDDVIRTVDFLQKSKKPLILAGYGVRSGQAVKELQKLCERGHIPVVTSRGGIDIIETDSRYYVGRPGGYGDRASHFAIQQCDCLLILGSRLSISTIGYYPHKLAQNAIKIVVDIDEKELEKEDVPVKLRIQTDVKIFINDLLNEYNEKSMPDREKWIAHCMDMRERFPNVKKEYAKEKPLNCYFVTEKLAELVDGNTNIVVDTGSVCNIVSQSWKIKKDQRYLISGGFSCMGFWATAIGACQKGRTVIAITGDGSAQMNIQELATLQYNRLPVKLFIYNNNGYMYIRHNQHNYLNDKFIGVGPDSGLQTPDYLRVAEAYDVKAVRITAEDNITCKIKEVLEYAGPVVCEVRVQEFAPIIPKIASKLMPDGTFKAAEFDDLYPFLGNHENT